MIFKDKILNNLDSAKLLRTEWYRFWVLLNFNLNQKFKQFSRVLRNVLDY